MQLLRKDDVETVYQYGPDWTIVFAQIPRHAGFWFHSYGHYLIVRQCLALPEHAS
jgi:hypothetical protein